MEQRQSLTTTNKKADNKGFSIMIEGTEYVGYIVINEKNAPADTVKNLQNPVIMKAVIAKAELRVFAPKADQAMDSVNDIINATIAETNEVNSDDSNTETTQAA